MKHRAFTVGKQPATAPKALHYRVQQIGRALNTIVDDDRDAKERRISLLGDRIWLNLLLGDGRAVKRDQERLKALAA